MRKFCLRKAIRVILFNHKHTPKGKKWGMLKWYYHNNYFHNIPPSIYLDGYKDGSNSHSWCANMFLLDCKRSIAKTRRNKIPTLVSKKHNLPFDVKLSYKQIKEAGFFDWLGKEAPKLDYYILREYN